LIHIIILKITSINNNICNHRKSWITIKIKAI